MVCENKVEDNIEDNIENQKIIDEDVVENEEIKDGKKLEEKIKKSIPKQILDNKKYLVKIISKFDHSLKE